MTTLTTAQEGRRTFILSVATAMALLSTVGLMSSFSDTSRSTPVIADRTPPGVRDAVILTAAQVDAMQDQPVVALAAVEPEARPAAVVAKIKAPATPVRTALALAADSQAEPAADMAPIHPIKMSLAMAPETVEAATVR